MSKLIFTPDGQFLLHWFAEQPTAWSAGASLAPEAARTRVVVWDLSGNDEWLAVPGYLVGLAYGCCRLNSPRQCECES